MKFPLIINARVALTQDGGRLPCCLRLQDGRSRLAIWRYRPGRRSCSTSDPGFPIYPSSHPRASVQRLSQSALCSKKQLQPDLKRNCLKKYASKPARYLIYILRQTDGTVFGTTGPGVASDRSQNNDICGTAQRQKFMATYPFGAVNSLSPWALPGMADAHSLIDWLSPNAFACGLALGLRRCANNI